MKIKLQQNLLGAALVGALAFTSILTRAADLSGRVKVRTSQSPVPP